MASVFTTRQHRPESDLISLIDRDPALASKLSPAHAELARRALRVPVLRLPVGPWDPPKSNGDGGLGYMITEGFMSRELQIADSRSIEPLGPGDILCPWHEDAVSFARSRFTVLEAAELANLTHEFSARAARFPGLLPAVFERAVRRSRYMAVFGAVDGIVGIDRRLMMVFWTLAERWGEFREQHVYLPVALQHNALAKLIAARRPSVSTALSRLQREGELERVEDGWLLLGSPPDAPQ